MRVIDRIEIWHNRASDTNFVWFPFQFLRPKPGIAIGMKLKLQMTACFGLYYGIFSALRGWLFSGTDLWQLAPQHITWALVIFALWFNIVTAPLWNRRAQRLHKQERTH